MSLINQVLRDLDQRHAPAPAASPALRAAPHAARPATSQRALRWSLGVVATAAAIAVGGWAQGSLRWPMHTAVGTTVGTTVNALITTPIATPVTTPITTPQATPLLVAHAVALPPTTVTTPSAAPAAAKPGPAPTQLAKAAPTPRATMPPAPAAATAAPEPEPRIDKRSSARTTAEQAEAHYQRGVTTHQEGRIDESAKLFTAALRADATHAAARLALAGVLIGQSRPDEALTLLQEGHALAPQQPALALMLGRLQAERQDHAAALRTLAAAEAQATGNAEFQGVQAAVLQQTGQHAEAAEKFAAALRLSPRHGVWWMGLGISLAETGQPAAAREAFERARAAGLPPGAAGYVEGRLRQLG